MNMKSTTPHLATLAQLRWQLNSLEVKVKVAHQLAVEEAIAVLGEGRSPNGRQMVYADKTTEIVLQFRTEKPKTEGNQDLEYLAEMIKIEQQKAEREHRAKIESLKIALSNIESALLSLQQTEEGRQFERDYEELIKQLTVMKPTLAVKLK